MKMYGSYSDADLNDWQKFPMVSNVLTQSAFGAWLMRRDENKAKQCPTIPLDKVKQAREEIKDTFYVDSLIFGELMDFKEGKISADDVIEEFNKVARKEVLEILDVLIEGGE